MSIYVPPEVPPFLQPELWCGTIIPIALVAISVRLSSRPRAAVAFHLGALALQIALLAWLPFSDWGAGPIAVIVLAGRLWRARPAVTVEPLAGLTRV